MEQPTELPLPYPTPTTPAATNRMRANRRSDTQPEVLLRSLLHRSGLRFRKDHPVRLSTGRVVRPDIAFLGKRLAVFVDGCFWHSCPLHGTVPKSNRDYWVPKLKQNVDPGQIGKPTIGVYRLDRGTNLGAYRPGVSRVGDHVTPSGAWSALELIAAMSCSEIS